MQNIKRGDNEMMDTFLREKRGILFKRVSSNNEFLVTIREVEEQGFKRIGRSKFSFRRAKKWYGEDSQIVVQLFFNSLNKRFEWQISNMDLMRERHKVRKEIK